MSNADAWFFFIGLLTVALTVEIMRRAYKL